MRLDVIIPAFEAHDTIDRAIASVMMQKVDDGDEVQILIVNDASPSGSYHDCAKYWAALGRYPVAVIDRKENGGVGQARQSGIDAGDGECFTCVDADDVLGSPFALRVMLDGMKLDYDVVMGQFVEETGEKTYVTHGANWVWMHGKCFSRKFVHANGLRFNKTRYNEDVGFNSVAHNLTDNVLYVPQVVYIWENRSDSTVRSKHEHYCYGYGWRSFIENMIWAEEELRERKVEREKIADFLAQATARLYWNSMDAHEKLPEEEEKNWPELKRFCRSALLRYADLLDWGRLRKGYFKVAEETPLASVAFMTFESFLDKIGYLGVNP